MSEQDIERIAEAAARRVVRAALEALNHPTVHPLNPVPYSQIRAALATLDEPQTPRDYPGIKLCERCKAARCVCAPPEQRAGLETLQEAARRYAATGDDKGMRTVGWWLERGSIVLTVSTAREQPPNGNNALVLRSDAEAAIAQARAEGRREAFEEAAREAEIEATRVEHREARASQNIAAWCREKARA